MSGRWCLYVDIDELFDYLYSDVINRDAQPTAAIIDAQSMKTVEESAPISGYDGHKNVMGRKRHLLVDSLGLPLSVYVTPADVQDRAGARCLLAGLKPLVPRLKKIWADGAYSGEELATQNKAGFPRILDGGNWVSENEPSRRLGE
jgi:Transposase DDE domain